MRRVRLPRQTTSVAHRTATSGERPVRRGTPIAVLR
jgi:hypothetical protein